MCNINEVLKCDKVTPSEYSAFLGVPIAFVGPLPQSCAILFPRCDLLKHGSRPRQNISTMLLISEELFSRPW